MVTISHLIPVALAYEFVPGYVAADAVQQGSLAVTFDTFANLALVLNYTGNALGWAEEPYRAGLAGSHSARRRSPAGSVSSRLPRA